ncbi:MarR family transcriptional regulator [Microbacterium rhizomatis]|uniref:MarR family transcriptional regulator n=2 Tax=Microbacterium rhizomatis TaxID=1631477 RepID=A0A5J5J1Q4_9MICO|nr:MarR family transcriptional regulator [Microbacterium rhizomatis]
MMTAAGMPRMPARTLMALIAAPAGGYTAAELGDRLGVSAAAVSGAVRYLQTLRMVHRMSRAGDRRDRYELAHDVWYGVMTSNAPLYDRLAGFIERIGDEQEDDPDARARAADMAAFFRFMSARMPQLVDEWEAQRAHRPR